jgi:hypothetical protein
MNFHGLFLLNLFDDSKLLLNLIKYFELRNEHDNHCPTQVHDYSELPFDTFELFSISEYEAKLVYDYVETLKKSNEN